MKTGRKGFMKQRNNLLAFLLLTTFFMVSCVDNEYYGSGDKDSDYQAEMPFDDLTIPGNFSWKTISTATVTVNVNDEFNGQYNYLVEVFDENPFYNPNASLLAKGLAKKSQSFTTKVVFPNTVTSLFIRQTAPNGLVSVRAAGIDEETIICDFSQASVKSLRTLTRASELGAVNFTPPAENDEGVYPTREPDGATVITTSSWYKGGTAAEYMNYIINSQSAGTLPNTGQYAAFYVTEDVTVSGIYNNANRKVFILPGKKLTITGGLGASTANWIISVGKGATLEIAGQLKMEQTNAIYNLGTVSTGTYHSVGSAQFYNKGTYTVTGAGETAMQMDKSSLFYNVGTVDIAAGGWKTTGTGGATIYNSGTGTITVKGAINQNTSGNRFINDNEVTCGDFISTGSAKTENNGLMTVLGKTETRSADTWINNSTWITETMVTVAYKANYLNRCKLIVNDSFELNQARFVNDAGAYIYAKAYKMVNTRMEMGALSFFKVEGTASFMENRPNAAEKEGFYGTGEERALLKFGKVVAGNTSPNIVYYGGSLQVACDDHPEAAMPSGKEPRWSMDGNVEWVSADNPVTTIPKTECNEGHGNTPVPPVEPEEPGDQEDPYVYTYMFEDEWPLYHDYDMNDVVIRIREITKTPNDDKKITKLKFTYSLEAVGASRTIAAALMLDGVNASQVQSVTYSEKQPTGFTVQGSGVESGSTKAVIPFFSNAHTFLGRSTGSFINTIRGNSNNVSPVPAVTVEVAFTNPVEASLLDAATFNLFIVTDAGENLNTNSRREVHLRGYNPTPRANTSLFGANNDNSKNGVLYSSKDNLVWAIVIPSSFRWPIESKNITLAYENFANWVQTNGEESQSWWKTPSDETNVFETR